MVVDCLVLMVFACRFVILILEVVVSVVELKVCLVEDREDLIVSLSMAVVVALLVVAVMGLSVEVELPLGVVCLWIVNECPTDP